MRRVDLDALDGLTADPEAERTGHLGALAAAAIAAGPSLATGPVPTPRPTVARPPRRAPVLVAVFVAAMAITVVAGRGRGSPTPSPGAPTTALTAALPAAAGTPAPRSPAPGASTSPLHGAPTGAVSPTVAAAPARHGVTPASPAPGPWTLRFAFDADEPDPAQLRQVTAAARSCPGTLRVTGHTCDVGDAAYNAALAARRAHRVATALVASGVDAAAVRATAGPPAAATSPLERRGLRRVDIVCQSTHER